MRASTRWALFTPFWQAAQAAMRGSGKPDTYHFSKSMLPEPVLVSALSVRRISCPAFNLLLSLTTQACFVCVSKTNCGPVSGTNTLSAINHDTVSATGSLYWQLPGMQPYMCQTWRTMMIPASVACPSHQYLTAEEVHVHPCPCFPAGFAGAAQHQRWAASVAGQRAAGWGWSCRIACLLASQWQLVWPHCSSRSSTPLLQHCRPGCLAALCGHHSAAF